MRVSFFFFSLPLFYIWIMMMMMSASFQIIIILYNSRGEYYSWVKGNRCRFHTPRLGSARMWTFLWTFLSCSTVLRWAFSSFHNKRSGFCFSSFYILSSSSCCCRRIFFCFWYESIRCLFSSYFWIAFHQQYSCTNTESHIGPNNTIPKETKGFVVFIILFS